LPAPPVISEGAWCLDCSRTAIWFDVWFVHQENSPVVNGLRTPRVEVRQTNLEDTAVVARDLEGCEQAFYLVHSMASARGAYAARDRHLALQFASAHTLLEFGESSIIWAALARQDPN
jgi:hypothetical protein